MKPCCAGGALARAAPCGQTLAASEMALTSTFLIENGRASTGSLSAVSSQAASSPFGKKARLESFSPRVTRWPQHEKNARERSQADPAAHGKQSGPRASARAHFGNARVAPCRQSTVAQDPGT